MMYLNFKKSVAQSITLAACVLLTGSCSKVAFESKHSDDGGVVTQATPTPTPSLTPVANTVVCNVKVNGQDAPVTIEPTGTNPTVTATCVPSDVTYTWTVQSNGVNVTVAGLAGASSVPNFKVLPAGSYDILLEATKTGYTTYTSGSPHRVIVSPPVVPPAIACNVYFNQQVSAVTVTSAATNPDLYADCHPTNVNLAWTVRDASNAVIPVNNLHGSSSHPDFFSLGSGAYKVTLNATASGYSEFNSTPITATVNAPPPPPQVIACDVKLNGQTSPVTINPSQSNPVVDANCSPSDVSYVWTVQSNSTNVTVSGLSGASSTPDFASMPPGSYDITLYSTKTGYQPYNSPTPRRVNIVPQPLVAKTFSATVNAQNNLLDILLIVDDSNSMLANNQRLANRLQGFVNDLTTSGFNWQMCVTVTRAQKVSTTSNDTFWGASNFWQGNPNSPAYILKSGTANISTIFTDTINHIGAGIVGSEDERPLKAAYWHFWNGDPSYNGASGCYRQNAGLAVVAIGNEDERSIGGDITQKFYSNEYYPLEFDDQPQNLRTRVRDIFGANKRFVFNSIMVRPGDNICMAAQDSQGTKSHYGAVISQMSALTHGYVGSICDSDYSQSLRYFKDQIVTTMASVTLECTPVGTPVVTISPSFTYTFRVEGSSVIFSPAIPAGRTIQIQYNCTQ